VSDVLAGVDAGRIARIAFVVPPGVTWSLPIYELALMTAAHAELRGLDVELTVVTAEPEPLTAFGRKSTEHVVEALAAAGVHLQTGTDVAAVGPGGALLGRDGYSLARAESVIAVPRLEGPDIGGLPHDDQGFVIVDAGGAVPRVPGVYAVGDAAAGPIKHGGLAAQQAEHVAHVIAQLAGAPVSVAEPRPVMRAHLLEGATSSWLRAPLDGESRGGVVSAEPLWWPPLKVAAPRLAGLLAERGS
jgi:sulfide:quinone oxidoreductase